MAMLTFFKLHGLLHIPGKDGTCCPFRQRHNNTWPKTIRTNIYRFALNGTKEVFIFVLYHYATTSPTYFSRLRDGLCFSRYHYQ